jgi:P27 family predicted phage terminase small subunit
MAKRYADNVRELTGTRSKPHDSPRFAPIAPPMPDFLGILGDERAVADAEREWERVVPALDVVGLLTVVDGFLVEDLCTTCARIRQAERQIAADGLMVEAAGRPDRGKVKHPLLPALSQLRGTYGRYCRLLGIGPASRQSLDVPAPAGGAESPLERVRRMSDRGRRPSRP